MSDLLKPKDRPEAVALFRAQVIGPLLCRDFGSHGQLAEAIRAIAAEPVRPPGHTTSRTYGPRRSSAGTTRSAKKGSAACVPAATSAALRWASMTRSESCCGRSARTTPR